MILVEYRIRKAARLRTSASVTAPASKHTAEKTLSRITVTKRSMYKSFQFHTGLVIDPFHLRKRYFTCHHDTLRTKTLHQSCTFHAGYCHLCAGMNRKTGKMLPNKRKHPHILYQYRIQSLLVKWQQIIIKFAC